MYNVHYMNLSYCAQYRYVTTYTANPPKILVSCVGDHMGAQRHQQGIQINRPWWHGLTVAQGQPVQLPKCVDFGQVAWGRPTLPYYIVIHII